MFRRPRPFAAPVRIEPVMGVPTAYTDSGSGPPIVLVNAGLGAASVWTRLLPDLAGSARVLTVDPPGSGASGRVEPEVESSYRLDFLRNHFEAFLRLTGVGEPVVLVVVGLASMVVFDWAARSPDRVRGICHMESVVEPWAADLIADPFREALMRSRSAEGERYVLYTDAYLDSALRNQLISRPDPETDRRFRTAFGTTAEVRRLQLSLMRQVPVDGAPAESAATVNRYADWLRTSSVPKLLILGKPGHILTGPLAASAAALDSQDVVEVPGNHLLPHDSPNGVSRHLASWLRRL